MILRDVQAVDVPAIHRLIDQLGYPTDEAAIGQRLERVLATPGHRVIVAEARDERRVIGVLHVYERPALERDCEAVVEAIVVDEECRGHGVGKALMREAEAWAKRRGLGATSLYTRAERREARDFYERLGYRLRATSHLMGRPQSH